MDLPFHYDHIEPLAFGGALPVRRSFDDSRVVILPVPVDRTTSYVSGTRNGPHEILQASSHMELWDEELRVDVHPVGIYTLPEMELPFGEMEPLVEEIERVAYEIIGRGKFLAAIGGEHSITPPLVSAAARKYPAMSVLQIDAHTDLRESYMGTRHNHACAMRRTLEYARVTQVGIRSLSSEEADVIPRLNTTIFYDVSMREDPAWIDAIVASLEVRRLRQHRRGRSRSRDHARDRHAGARRAVVDGGHEASPDDRRAAAHRRVRFGRAQSHPRHGGADVLVREAPLQTVHLLLRERPAVAPRWGLTQSASERARSGQTPVGNWRGYRDLT